MDQNVRALIDTGNLNTTALQAAALVDRDTSLASALEQIQRKQWIG